MNELKRCSTYKEFSVIILLNCVFMFTVITFEIVTFRNFVLKGSFLRSSS